MKNNGKKPHLWIPNEETTVVSKKPTGRNKDLGLNHTEHGSVLSTGLTNILSGFSTQNEDSLNGANDCDGIIVFKMALPDGQDVCAKKTIVQDEGLTINAVKNKNHAIVSTKKSLFQRLQMRVEKYRKLGSLKQFQYVEEFSPFTAEDKQTNPLKSELATSDPSKKIDIQLMLLPNLPQERQSTAVKNIIRKIQDAASDTGKSDVKQYTLSDGTPVIRALLSAAKIKNISKDSAIYRMEQTSFFQLSPCEENEVDLSNSLDTTVSTGTLPVVAVLDDGIDFLDVFQTLVLVSWNAPGCSGIVGHHGTPVAGKIVFGHIGKQLDMPSLKPRARVIDCNIYGSDPRLASDTMAERIAEAVNAFAGECQIFNLSSNSEIPIEGDELSILGYQLDCLMKKHNIKFVISAGNHTVANTSTSLEEILQDDDIRISEPADSMLGITVGAVAGKDHNNGFSKINEVTAYSRIGPGFAGFYKPDLVAYGANLCKDKTTPKDEYSIVMSGNGKLSIKRGTSFTAPIVAGDLAELLAIVPNRDVLLAQALLYNGATRLWSDKDTSREDAKFTGNIFGRGLSSPERSKYSSPHRVSFLRTGTLKPLYKERVKFLMPTQLSEVAGRRTTSVTVTCLTNPPIDKTKGSQYLGAYISASLHKLNKSGKLATDNPSACDNRNKWDTCYHFMKTFSDFSGGDWEIWLELFSRWETGREDGIPYALVVTIEDLTRTVDIYQAIQNQAQGRFHPLITQRIRETERVGL